MNNCEPQSIPVGRVDFGGFFLTHAIWRNGYGSYEPETGVRTHANGLKDFRLIQHGCDDWPMVTAITLVALSKGWAAERIADVVARLHARRRRQAMRRNFKRMHDNLARS